MISAVVVTSADTDDRLGLVEWLIWCFADAVKLLRNIGIDGAYPAEWREAWGRGVKQTHTIDLEATTNKAGRASR